MFQLWRANLVFAFMGFRPQTKESGMLNLGECLSLEADNLPSAVYLSIVLPHNHLVIAIFFHFFYLESYKLRFPANLA